jgi:hypothetical protein
MLDILLAVLDMDYPDDDLPYLLAEQFAIHGFIDPA